MLLRWLAVNDMHSNFKSQWQMLYLARSESGASKEYEVEVGGYALLKAYIDEVRATLPPYQVLRTAHLGDELQGSPMLRSLGVAPNIEMLRDFHFDYFVVGNHEFDFEDAGAIDMFRELNCKIMASNLEFKGSAWSSLLMQSRQFDVKDFLSRFKSQQMCRSCCSEDYRLHYPLGDCAPLDLIRLGANYPPIAVFGLQIDDFHSVSHASFEIQVKPSIEQAKQIVELCHSSGVQHIIALTHQGLEKDLELAQACPELSLIVGSHSHHLMHHFRTVELEYQPQVPELPYYEGAVPIVQFGSNANFIGDLLLEVRPLGRFEVIRAQSKIVLSELAQVRSQGELLQEKERLCFLDSLRDNDDFAILTPNKKIEERIKHFESLMPKDPDKEVFSFDKSLRHIRIPDSYGGSSVAPLVARSMLWAVEEARAQGRSDVPPQDFALFNAGGVRTSIPSGSLHSSFVKQQLLPFPSVIHLASLKGSELAEFIFDALHAAMEASTGSFPYFWGLRYKVRLRGEKEEVLVQSFMPYEIDRGRAIVRTNTQSNPLFNHFQDCFESVGVIEVWNYDETKTLKTSQDQYAIGSWKSVDPHKLYHFSVPGFVAKGKDGYIKLENKEVELFDEGYSCAQSLIDFLSSQLSVKN